MQAMTAEALRWRRCKQCQAEHCLHLGAKPRVAADLAYMTKVVHAPLVQAIGTGEKRRGERDQVGFC